MQTFLVPKKFVFSVTSAWTANGVVSLTGHERKEGKKITKIRIVTLFE